MLSRPDSDQPTHELVLHVNAEDRLIAYWAAIAIALAVVEAGIPSPVPGVKPGLANLVTLLILARAGWQAAAWVSLLRILGAALILGSLFTPGFALSLAGGVCSLLMLALASQLPWRWFGPVSWSLLSSIGHMAGQIAMARLWLIPNDGIFYLSPLLFGMAVLFGLSNGLIAAHLLHEKRLPQQPKGED